MIVVIGSPVLRRAPGSPTPQVAGLAGAIALGAAAEGRPVQLVGKMGNDAAGDAVLIALAAAGVGHAAVLRDPAHPTPVVESAPSEPPETSIEDALFADEADGSTEPEPLPSGLALDAADIELALRYLTEFRVVVVAAPLEARALDAALEAAGFAEAHVIRVDPPAARSSAAAESPAGVEITIFEAPAGEEPAFASLVARYAAGIDAGRTPRESFADAARGANWERAAAD